jgi:DNA-binding NtrC family response regulator
VLDVRLPGVRGLELQQRLAAADLAMPIIFMTGHGDIPITVQAMQAGAVECLTHVDRSNRGVEGCLAYLRRGGTDWAPPPTRDAGRREDDRRRSLVGSRHIEEHIALPLRSNPGGRDRAG